MHSYVQLLGGGTPDGGRSLLIFFDLRRYLFGCGEGTQRYCTEYHIRLTRVQVIFLPTLNWSMVGGIPGMVCTVADAGGEALKIVGPRGTAHFIASLRAFVRRPSLAVEVIEVAHDAINKIVYQDDCITVRATTEFLEEVKVEVEERESSAGNGKGNIGNANNVQNRENSHYYHKQHHHHSNQKSSHHGQHSPTNHEIKRCRTNHNIINDNGKEYQPQEHSHQHSPPPPPPPPPPPQHPSTIILRKMFKTNFIDKDTNSSEKNCLLHEEDWPLPVFPYQRQSLIFQVEGPLVPGKFDIKRAQELQIPSGPLYGALSRGETIYLPNGQVVEPHECVGSSQLGGLLTITSHLTPSTLHLEDYSLKFFLGDTEPSEKQFGNWIWWKNKQCLLSSAQEILYKLNLDPILASLISPMYSVNDDQGPIPLTKFRWHPPPSSREFESISPNLKISNFFPPLPVATPTNPIITFLGTGAALPGKYRNVSSTLIDFGDAAFLLDCGEGTMGQLYRRFGEENLKIILSRINRGAIIISHLHADHHIGLPMFLCSNYSSTSPSNETWSIVAPQRYELFLQELAQCTPLHPYKFYPVMDGTERWTWPPYHGGVLDHLAAIPVIHCANSYGFVLQRDNLQIVFSGDTRPCTSLIKVAHELMTSLEGSSQIRILIHEATFDDTLIEEAIEKKHSTISEAIEVGQFLKANYILLTHFSQRFAKCIPPIPLSPSQSSFNILPVIDYMSLSLHQLQSINFPQILSKLLELLPISDDEKE